MNIKIHIQFQIRVSVFFVKKVKLLSYMEVLFLIFCWIFILFSVVANRDKFNLDVEFLFYFVSPYFYDFWMTLIARL